MRLFFSIILLISLPRPCYIFVKRPPLPPANMQCQKMFWALGKKLVLDGFFSISLSVCTILGLRPSSPSMSLAREVSYLFVYICFYVCFVLFLCFCSLRWLYIVIPFVLQLKYTSLNLDFLPNVSKDLIISYRNK